MSNTSCLDIWCDCVSGAHKEKNSAFYTYYLSRPYSEPTSLGSSIHWRLRTQFTFWTILVSSWSRVICADKGRIFQSGNLTLEQDQLTACLGAPSSPSDHLRLIPLKICNIWTEDVGRAQTLDIRVYWHFHQKLASTFNTATLQIKHSKDWLKLEFVCPKLPAKVFKHVYCIHWFLQWGIWPYTGFVCVGPIPVVGREDPCEQKS